MPNPLGTKEQRAKVRQRLEHDGFALLDVLGYSDALDGLDVAEDREEHMGSDKIHGAYCLNCLELSRRWQNWQGAGGTKGASPRG